MNIIIVIIIIIIPEFLEFITKLFQDDVIEGKSEKHPSDRVKLAKI
jgi:hypothetical protein